MIIEEAIAQAATGGLSTTTNRLRQEIVELRRGGNLNLILGILTTICGVAVLGYVVFAEQDVDPSDHWKYVVH
jgi:hypothetical protein